jgi:hypothetical protein
MSGRFLRVLVAGALLGCLLPACKSPESTELFVRRTAAQDGVYIYSLPLTDTTAAYDIWFYSRVSEHPLHSLQLNVRWLSPSGESLAETVYMRSVERRGTRELYRSGLVPAEAGDWQLSVRPVGVDEDFLGLGVICKRQDGTR